MPTSIDPDHPAPVDSKNGPKKPKLDFFRTVQAVFWLVTIAVDLQKLGVFPHA